MFRHVLRNACLPIVTIAGVQIGNLLGGSVDRGVGVRLAGLRAARLRALFTRDLNLLMGIFFVSACLVIVVNIMVDLIYSLLDPRIRLE